MHIIRTSDRLQFKRCRRAWDLGSKIRQNYEPLLVPKPLDFGTAIHAGLEEYYRPEFWNEPQVLKESTALSRVGQVISEQRDKYLKVTEREDLDIDVQRDFEEELTLAVAMLQHYFTVAPVLDHFWTPVKVEIEFEVPIPDPDNPEHQLSVMGVPVFYQGRIDLLVIDQDGRYWIVDHKTAGQFGNTEWLDMDEQGGSYCWAISTMLGIPIAGVIYNRLLKAAPSKPEPLLRPQKGRNFSVNKQQRTTYAVYKKALEEANEPIAPYLEFLQYLKDEGNPFFQRVQTYRTQTEQLNLQHQIGLEAIDMLTNPSIYPNAGMFNCMGCSYKQPCLAMNDGSDYKYILNDLFQKRSS